MSIKDIVEQLFFYPWPTNEELVHFAENGDGFGGDDGYYGLIYPCDLDEYDRKVDKSFISEGFVEIYYFDGQIKEMQIREKEYLLYLENYLEDMKEYELARRIFMLKN